MREVKEDLANAEKEIELSLEQDYDTYMKWLKSQQPAQPPPKAEAKKPAPAPQPAPAAAAPAKQ